MQLFIVTCKQMVNIVVANNNFTKVVVRFVQQQYVSSFYIFTFCSSISILWVVSVNNSWYYIPVILMGLPVIPALSVNRMVLVDQQSSHYCYWIFAGMAALSWADVAAAPNYYHCYYYFVMFFDWPWSYTTYVRMYIHICIWPVIIIKYHTNICSILKLIN